MKDATVLSLVLACALGASAQQATTPEPYSVKGDKLGETSAEWLASDPDHKNWVCEDVSHVADGKPVTCVWDSLIQRKPKVAPATYAGIELFKQGAYFIAKDGKLLVYRVDLTFCNGDGYEAALMSALNEKFGIPSHKVTLLQNGFGATSQEDTWFWTNGVSTITLDYILPEPIYHSPVVMFTLNSLLKEVQDRQDKAARDKARSDM